MAFPGLLTRGTLLPSSWHVCAGLWSPHHGTGSSHPAQTSWGAKTAFRRGRSQCCVIHIAPLLFCCESWASQEIYSQRHWSALTQMKWMVSAQAKLPGEAGRGRDEQSLHCSASAAEKFTHKGGKTTLSSLPTLYWGQGMVLDVTSLLPFLQPHHLSLAPGCPCKNSYALLLILLTSSSELVGEVFTTGPVFCYTSAQMCSNTAFPQKSGTETDDHTSQQDERGRPTVAG